jgi:hypothetical protein
LPGQTAAKNINDGTHNLVTVIEIMGRRNWLEMILKINLSVSTTNPQKRDCNMIINACMITVDRITHVF